MVVRRAVCLLGVTIALALWLSSGRASAAPQYYAFTPQRATFRADGRHGVFDAQVRYRGRTRLQWSYQLYARTSASAVGPMEESTYLYCDGRRVRGYRNFHPVIPAGYLVHSSVAVSTGCDYHLAITETFPIRTKSGTGVRAVGADFYFVVTLV